MYPPQSKVLRVALVLLTTSVEVLALTVKPLPVFGIFQTMPVLVNVHVPDPIFKTLVTVPPDAKAGDVTLPLPNVSVPALRLRPPLLTFKLPLTVRVPPGQFTFTAVTPAILTPPVVKVLLLLPSNWSPPSVALQVMPETNVKLPYSLV